MRIYRYKQGSNQFVKKQKSHALEVCCAIALTLYTGALAYKGISDYTSKNATVDYLKQFQFGQFTPLVVAAEPQLAGVEKEVTNNPNLEQLISYIVKKFQPEGKAVVVKAISCFYSESGLRPDAYNWNPGSNSEDIGVAQVNLKYHPDVTKEEMYHWMKNIDKAYQIYKSRGNFSAWYGKLCN